MRTLSSVSIPRDWLDLAAFVAVLTTGVILVVVGHLQAPALVTVCTALVGLYAAWRNLRPVRHARRGSPDELPTDEEQKSDTTREGL